MTRDARLSALHRGGFGHRVRAFQSPAAASACALRGHPDPSQRAPRSQVVVPDGRGPGPPGASGYKPPPQDATPRSAFRMSPETPLKERGCESCSSDAGRSQAINSICRRHFFVVGGQQTRRSASAPRDGRRIFRGVPRELRDEGWNHASRHSSVVARVPSE